MDKNLEIISDIKTALRNLDADVTTRNADMNERDWYIYGDGLWSRIDIDEGNDRTLYNLLPRVVDIHSSQLMGRGFNIYSSYDKEDLDAFSDPVEKELAQKRNRIRKANADARKRAVDGIIRDIGGMKVFKEGARIGSAYGVTVFKSWPDRKNKKWNISLIESPQNYRAFWKDSNFRDRDADAYVYQISVDSAMREYGKILNEGEAFELSSTLSPLGGDGGNNLTSDPLDQLGTTSYPQQTDIQMVTVIDFTGYRKGLCGYDGEVTKCKPGDETPFNLLIVGGHIAETITKTEDLPSYYIINNRVRPRRAWGESDIPRSALEINETIIQMMSDQITKSNKTSFPLVQAKGFTPTTIPKKKPRKMQVVATTLEQELSVVNMNNGTDGEHKAILDQLIDYFVRVTGVGRVLFDDPTVNANSNQALMTTLKSVIDIVEDKQSRWEPVLLDMFTDALKGSARFIPELKDAISEDDWHLICEFPSVLRKEDASYQQMWLNLFNAGVISWETYLEKVGIPDTGEEMDRLRDEMTDPTAAAVNSRQLGLLAQPVIATPMPPAPMPGAMSGQDAAMPTLTPDQNTGQTVSQPGSGAPAVSSAGANAQIAQNTGA